MKYYLILIAFFAFNLLNAQVENKTISHDGVDREYIVHVPSYYDGSEPLPLLFCFHGYTSNANALMLYSGFNNLSESRNFIAVYPQGLLHLGNTHWNVGGFTIGSTVNDVDFVDTLLDELLQNYNIDESRVYSTGMSNGGFMSFLLACQLSNRITAVASVTGSMTPETYNACNPQRIVPVLQIHGDDDSVVPYNGAIWTRPINDVLSYWSDHNNCKIMPEVYSINNTNESDGSTVIQLVYDEGSNCSSVIHFKVEGGGHDWPGAWGNMDINASIEVWDFLSQYDMDGLIGCTTSIHSFESSSNEYSIYPNPSADFINIETQKNGPSDYKILNANGQIVKMGTVFNIKDKILINNLEPNLYFLLVNNKVQKFIKL